MKKIATLLCALTILFGNNYIVKAESIQEEIERIKEMADTRESEIVDAETQGEMNFCSLDVYNIWDEELNSLWKRLSKELPPELKKKVLAQQRAWIKRKIENVNSFKEEYSGGSLGVLEGNMRATIITELRVYILAKYLAEIRNEPFNIKNTPLESIHLIDPLLHDIFKRFEGQWFSDEESDYKRIIIERTDACLYGVEGSNWTIWGSDEIILSDLNVHNYTSDKIIFKDLKKGKDIFYKISFSYEGSLILSIWDSLENLKEFETDPFSEIGPKDYIILNKYKYTDIN